MSAVAGDAGEQTLTSISTDAVKHLRSVITISESMASFIKLNFINIREREYVFNFNELSHLSFVDVSSGIAVDTAVAVASRPGVSPHAAAATAAVPKEMMKDAVIPMHSISATLYVKGLTYQHILSVDMFTKEQVYCLILTLLLICINRCSSFCPC